MRIMVRLKFGVTEPHQAAAIPGRDVKARAPALMCLSKDTVCRRRLLLFLLAGLLLCLLRFLSFLSHVALHDPKVGSMQVDLDTHKCKVYHDRKIDTARSE